MIDVKSAAYWQHLPQNESTTKSAVKQHSAGQEIFHTAASHPFDSLHGRQKKEYGKSFLNLFYTEHAKMQKALLSNKARWSRNRAHPFQAVSHSKQGGKMNGSLCNLCAKCKKDCRAHDRKSCFSVPSSECEVQTRSLLEG